VPELIAYAKANPGKINMASPGNGTSPHIFGELFKMMAGVDLVHVPYRGSYMPDLLGGEVQVAFSPTPLLIEYIRTGKLRALAVTTAKRVEALPDVATLGEFVRGYEAIGGMESACPKTHPPRLSTRSTKRPTSLSPNPNLRRSWPTYTKPLSG